MDSPTGAVDAVLRAPLIGLAPDVSHPQVATMGRRLLCPNLTFKLQDPSLLSFQKVSPSFRRAEGGLGLPGCLAPQLTGSRLVKEGMVWAVPGPRGRGEGRPAASRLLLEQGTSEVLDRHFPAQASSPLPSAPGRGRSRAQCPAVLRVLGTGRAGGAASPHPCSSTPGAVKAPASAPADSRPRDRAGTPWTSGDFACVCRTTAR